MSDLNVAQLKEKLDEQGIEYPASAVKAVLIALLNGDEQPVDKIPDYRVWVKKDGETEVKLNSLPATEAKAKKLGWKIK